MRRRIACATAAILALFANSSLEAQQQPFKRTDVPTVIAGNAAVGGLTAAIHAAATGKPIGKALARGFLGGTVHGYGKILQPELGYGGVAIGALGASMVANAGRGLGMFDELMLPLGPARLRYSRVTGGLGFSLSAYESAMLVQRMLRPGHSIDWTRSLQSGTFVLNSATPLSGMGGLRANGLTKGSTIVLSDFARDPATTLDHERIHVQQEMFLQEIWGRPLEAGLRERSRALRWVPKWLEFGALGPVLLKVERKSMGWDGPIRTWRESEAETIEERSRP